MRANSWDFLSIGEGGNPVIYFNCKLLQLLKAQNDCSIFEQSLESASMESQSVMISKYITYFKRKTWSTSIACILDGNRCDLAKFSCFVVVVGVFGFRILGCFREELFHWNRMRRYCSPSTLRNEINFRTNHDQVQRYTNRDFQEASHGIMVHGRGLSSLLKLWLYLQSYKIYKKNLLVNCIDI